MNLERRASRRHSTPLNLNPEFSGGLNRAIVTLQSEQEATHIETEARGVFSEYTYAAWSTPPQTDILRSIETAFFHSDVQEIEGDSVEAVSIQYLKGNIRTSLDDDTPYREILMLSLKRSKELKLLIDSFRADQPNAQETWNTYHKEFQFLKAYSALAVAFHYKDRRFICKLWKARSPKIPQMPKKEIAPTPATKPVEQTPEDDLSSIITTMLSRRGEPLLYVRSAEPVPLPPTEEPRAKPAREKKSRYSYEELLGDDFDGNALVDLLGATQSLIAKHSKDLQGYKNDPILLLNHIGDLLDQVDLLNMLKDTFNNKINAKSTRRLALMLKAMEKIYIGHHGQTMEAFTKHAELIQRGTATELFPAYPTSGVVFTTSESSTSLRRPEAQLHESPKGIRFPVTDTQIHDALIQAFKDIDAALANERMGPIQGNVDHRQLAKMHNGLNRTMLQYYADTDIVSPDYEGNIFHYGKVRVAQLFMLARFRPMDNGGITPQELKKTMRKIRTQYGKTRSEYGRMKNKEKQKSK
jgi:hypothetical protein